MNQQQALAAVGQRIVPILQEFGIESFVMLGYIRTEEKLERFNAISLKRDDVAQVDALRQVVGFGVAWAAPDQMPPPDGDN